MPRSRAATPPEKKGKKADTRPWFLDGKAVPDLPHGRPVVAARSSWNARRDGPCSHAWAELVKSATLKKAADALEFTEDNWPAGWKSYQYTPEWSTLTAVRPPAPAPPPPPPSVLARACCGNCIRIRHCHAVRFEPRARRASDAARATVVYCSCRAGRLLQ